MLLSHRFFRFPTKRAFVGNHAVFTRFYRLRLMNHVNVVMDDRSMWSRDVARTGFLGRPLVSIVLAGRLQAQYANRSVELGPGGLAVFPERSGLFARQDGAPFSAMTFEWDVGGLGTRRPTSVAEARLSLGEVETLWTFARAIVRGTPQGCAGSVGLLNSYFATFLSVLGAHGIELDRHSVGELIEPVGVHDATLSRLLDESLTRIEVVPSLAAFAERLGGSERQAVRDIQRFNADYGFNASSWRDTVHRWRLIGGVVGMTSPGARTEDIARALGYSSPTTFCRAFAEAGLDSPGAIAARFRSHEHGVKY